jgi:hypothetical protein
MAYKYDANGNKITVSRYTIKGVPSSTRIFPDIPDDAKKLIKRKRGSKGKLQKKYGQRTNAGVMRKIFLRMIFMVLERVATGDLFILPGIAQDSICLKSIPDDEIKKLRKQGKYSNINLLKTGLKIPRFVYDFGPNSRVKDRQIYVGKELERKSFKSAENGSVKWTMINKKVGK